MAEFTYVDPNRFYVTEALYPMPVTEASEWSINRVALTEDERDEYFNAGTPTPRQHLPAEIVLDMLLFSEGHDAAEDAVFLVEVVRGHPSDEWTPYVVLTQKDHADQVVAGLRSAKIYGATATCVSRTEARKRIRAGRAHLANLGLPRG